MYIGPTHTPTHIKIFFPSQLFEKLWCFEKLVTEGMIEVLFFTCLSF